MYNFGVPGNAFAQMQAGYGGAPAATGSFGAGGGGKFDWKKMAGMSAAGGMLGGALGNLFGGGGDAGKYYDVAMGKYQTSMDEALRMLREHEATGRGDITKYLTEAQAYGAPYREAGGKGLTSYMGSLGLGGEAERQGALQSFHESPGYRYALNQALQQTQRGMTGAGLRGSGAEQKALMKQAMGMAEQQYGGWQEQLAKLAGMGGVASEAAAGRQFQTGGTLANLGLQYGGQMSQLQQALAQAQAEAEMAKGQAQAQSGQDWWSSLGSIAGTAASFYI